MLTIEVNLPSPIPSKKNSKTFIYRNGKGLLVSSEQFVKWHKRAVKNVIEKTAQYGTQEKVKKIEALIGMSDKRKRDLDNALTSVLDLLKDGKLISDDCWSVVPEITAKAMYGSNISMITIWV